MILMSKYNVKEELLQFVKTIKDTDYKDIIGEGPENCEHNKSTIYYQGIIHKSAVKKYCVMAYENVISEHNIEQMFEFSNVNNNREKNSIATRGKGIKLILHKIADRVNIISTFDDNTIKGRTLDINKHIKEVKNKNNKKSLDELHCKNCVPFEYNNFEDFKEDKGILSNIINNLKLAFINNKITIPKSFIICQLNDEYINQCDDFYDDCVDIFSMKYYYVKDYDIFMFKMDLNNIDNFYIEKLEYKDILGLDNKEDSITFYIKHIKRDNRRSSNDYCIIFLKGKKNRYFLWKPQGINKPSKYKEITKKDKYLIDNCNENYDYSVNFYRIENEYHKKIKPYSSTGVYLMTNKDNTILSIKPKCWINYCGAHVGNCNYWGHKSRLVIRINEKKYFNIRGIKTESQATSNTTRIIKNTFQIFKETKQYKMKNESLGTKFININDIANIILDKTTKKPKKPKPPKPTKPKPKPPKIQNGYIYCIFDNTRPGLVKLGKSEKDVSIDSERIASGYVKRYFPLGTKCIKKIKVSNPTLAEKLLFEQCKNERISDTEWFFIEKINKRIKEGLFEGIKNSIDKKI